MKIWMVIPAYNEAKHLEKLLLELKNKGLNTIIIDDGSKDSTYAVAVKTADIVIQNEKNLGKGMSLRRAINFLLENEKFDYIITMDADGQHSVLDLDAFIKSAAVGESFVVGNRMEEPRGMPWVRILTNKAMSWLLSKIAKQSIPDTQCGMRLIARMVLGKISFETSNFEFESEMLIKAAKAGFTIKSIPIQSIYFRNVKSRINPFFDTLRFLKFVMSLDKIKNETHRSDTK